MAAGQRSLGGVGRRRCGPPGHAGRVDDLKAHPGLPVVLTSRYSHVLAEEGRHGFELLHKPYAAEELSRGGAGGAGTIPVRPGPGQP
jgi:hypothetical protein